MTEVKRYHVTEAGLAEGKALGRINVVLGADHDRLTADADRLRAELECSRGDFAQLGRISEALQQRLTAADERVDVLETALKKISVRCVAYIDAEREMPEPSVEVCQMIAYAALKPAEGGGKPCACPGCDAPKVGSSVFCAAHRSAKSRTRGQDPLTADGLEWLMQNDGLQQ